MVFDTKTYFELNGVTNYFYPSIPIVFQVSSFGHYHIPLLLSKIFIFNKIYLFSNKVLLDTVLIEEVNIEQLNIVDCD